MPENPYQSPLAPAEARRRFRIPWAPIFYGSVCLAVASTMAAMLLPIEARQGRLTPRQFALLSIVTVALLVGLISALFSFIAWRISVRRPKSDE